MENKTDFINTNQAMKIIREHDIACTRPSLLSWVEKYHLGKKIAGRWYIDKKRLYKFLKGEVNAN